MANEILFIDYRLSLSINPKYNNAIDELKEASLTVYSAIVNKIADDIINYDKVKSRSFWDNFTFGCERNADNEYWFKEFSPSDIKKNCYVLVYPSTLTKLVRMGLLKRFGKTGDGHTYTYAIPDDLFISDCAHIKFAE